MAPIAGHSVLIIGGTSGMGFGVAKLALAEKVKVHIASSSAAKVKDAVERLRASPGGGDVSGHTIDLMGESPEAELEELLKSATASGPLDHIVYTAGRAAGKPIAEIDLATAVEMARMPLFVPLLVAKLGPAYLKEGYASSMIFTSGQVVEKPMPGYSVLASLVAGSHAMVRGLAIDLAPRRVNLVAPGPTETELWGESAAFMRKMVSEQSPLGKPGAPEDVAEAYIYLMKNQDATGSIVSTNGGIVLK
ncbi:putative short chain dehydrogenase/ reductase [Xylariaceae sp. FL0804]|nr:putative short chain dehydrogenase/ reductase [Xylariaceae sp. FL0804]